MHRWAWGQGLLDYNRIVNSSFCGLKICRTFFFFFKGFRKISLYQINLMDFLFLQVHPIKWEELNNIVNDSLSYCTLFQEKPDKDKYVYECQHGEQECLGNMIEVTLLFRHTLDENGKHYLVSWYVSVYLSMLNGMAFFRHEWRNTVCVTVLYVSDASLNEYVHLPAMISYRGQINETCSWSFYSQWFYIRSLTNIGCAQWPSSSLSQA